MLIFDGYTLTLSKPISYSFETASCISYLTLLLVAPSAVIITPVTAGLYVSYKWITTATI